MSNIPDSGERSKFSTGAVRDASAGKGWPSSIPPDFLRAVAKRYEDGGTKYDKDNWMKGIPLSRYIDSAMRHLLQLMEGDDSEDHAGAVGWNMAGFMWTKKQILLGNLPKTLYDLSYDPKTKELNDEEIPF